MAHITYTATVTFEGTNDESSEISEETKIDDILWAEEGVYQALKDYGFDRVAAKITNINIKLD